MRKPLELVRCELIDGMAQRYGQLPTTVMESDVSNLRVMLTVVSAQCPKCGVVHSGGCKGAA